MSFPLLLFPAVFVSLAFVRFTSFWFSGVDARRKKEGKKTRRGRDKATASGAHLSRLDSDHDSMVNLPGEVAAVDHRRILRRSLFGFSRRDTALNESPIRTGYFAMIDEESFELLCGKGTKSIFRDSTI